MSRNGMKNKLVSWDVVKITTPLELLCVFCLMRKRPEIECRNILRDYDEPSSGPMLLSLKPYGHVRYFSRVKKNKIMSLIKLSLYICTHWSGCSEQVEVCGALKANWSRMAEEVMLIYWVAPSLHTLKWIVITSQHGKNLQRYFSMLHYVFLSFLPNLEIWNQRVYIIKTLS